jgi:hypothetical protein
MSSPLSSWVFQRKSRPSPVPPPSPYAVKPPVRHRFDRLVAAGMTLMLCGLASGPGFAREQLTLTPQPLTFEPNLGQTGAAATFLARGKGYILYLRPTEAILALKAPSQAVGKTKRIRMHLLGAAAHARTVGQAPLPGRHNYYVGNNPALWRIGIPTYAKVAATGVYPGIDMVYYGKEGLLEYDFMVAAGADPRAIRLGFDGADKLRVNRKGELLITTGKAQLIQHAPYAYQDIAGKRVPVSARYTLHKRIVSLALGGYDRNHPLIIDPALSYSSYLGGSSNDKAQAVAVDGDGNIYVTGSTMSPDFPGATVTGTTLKSTDTNTDAFVTKISKTGTVVFSTYLGTDSFIPGTEGDAIAVDKTGKIYVTGAAASSPIFNPFPTQNPYSPCTNGNLDVFVAVLNGQGTLNYSTCVGGGAGDKGLGIAVDSNGAAYVVGWTTSISSASAFPTTLGALQKTFDQSTPGLYSSFFFKLDPSQTSTAQLVYSTYLGCALSNTACGAGATYATAVAVDSSNIAYVAGWTAASADKFAGTGFPTANALYKTLNGTQDAYFYKLDPSVTGISGLLYASYFGGGDTNTSTGNFVDKATGIAIDTAGNIYITGATTSSNLPTTPNAFQSSYGGGGTTLGDAFVAKFSPVSAGSNEYNLSYSTYLGGSGEDGATGIAVDSTTGRAYVTGSTTSTNFPIQAATNLQAAFNKNINASAKDAFVTSLEASGSTLHYSTYLGGELDDQGQGIAVTATDKAYVVGYTPSFTFPVTSNAAQPVNNSNQQSGGLGFDAFVSRIAPVANLSAVIAAHATNDLINTAPPVGNSLTYSIVVANLGPDPATGITLSLGLSAPDDLATTTPLATPSYDNTICQYDSNGKELFTCSLPDLAVSDQQTITISGILSTGSNIVATTTLNSNELLDPVSSSYTLTAEQPLPPPSTIVTGGTAPTTSTPSVSGGGGALGGPLILILALAGLGRYSRYRGEQSSQHNANGRL